MRSRKSKPCRFEEGAHGPPWKRFNLSFTSRNIAVIIVSDAERAPSIAMAATDLKEILGLDCGGFGGSNYQLLRSWTVNLNNRCLGYKYKRIKNKYKIIRDSLEREQHGTEGT